MTTFTLSGLNSDFATSGFQLNNVSVTDELNMDHKVELTADKQHWNSLFYFSPESPGLADRDDLVTRDVYGNESILYKTVSANFQDTANTTIKDITTTPVGEDNLGLESIPENGVTVADSSIKVWSKKIFAGQENLDDLWANRTNVVNDINNFLVNTSSSDFIGILRDRIDQGNNLKNQNDNADDVDETKTNLTRQLVFQLHQAVYNKPIDGVDYEYRLTKTEGTNGDKGMFHDDFSADRLVDGDDTYYPFKFIAGDKLRFGLTLKHPDQYTSAVFEGSQTPSDMKFEIVVTME